LLTTILEPLDALAALADDGIAVVTSFIWHERGLGQAPHVIFAAGQRSDVVTLRDLLHHQMPPQDRASFPLRIQEDGPQGAPFQLVIHPPALPL